MIRKNKEWKDIRFVIMSANVHDERLSSDVVRDLNGVIPKPFNLDDLGSILY